MRGQRGVVGGAVKHYGHAGFSAAGGVIDEIAQFVCPHSARAGETQAKQEAVHNVAFTTTVGAAHGGKTLPKGY